MCDNNPTDRPYQYVSSPSSDGTLYVDLSPWLFTLDIPVNKYYPTTRLYHSVSGHVDLCVDRSH